MFVRSIIEVAHGMGKLAVAEFVEDEQTLQLLQGMGVDMVRGAPSGQAPCRSPRLVIGRWARRHRARVRALAPAAWGQPRARVALSVVIKLLNFQINLKFYYSTVALAH